MAKKKTFSKIGDLQRDSNGYGRLSTFVDFHIPEEGFAEGAVVNDHEIALVYLEHDQAGAGVDYDNLLAWNPSAPDGENWKLAAIDDSDAGPFALWVRPASTKASTRAHASEFLLGSLIKACTKHLKTLSRPWIDMKENDQRRVLNEIHVDCRNAVRDAIDIISSNARLTFPAAVDQVVFKDGVKCVLTLAKSAEAHSLADAEGSYVTIVIEERSKLLQEGDALTVDPDQKPLFDASTEGQPVATEKTILDGA